MSGAFSGASFAFSPHAAGTIPDIPLPGSGRAIQTALAPTHDSRVTAFAARFGGRWDVDWNPITGTPHMMLGSGTDYAGGGIHSEAEATAAARSLVAANPALFGASAADFDVAAVAQGAGKWAVHFQQKVQGVPVEGARARVCFTENGRLVVLGSDAYPVPAISVVPVIQRQDAISRAAMPVGYDGSGDEVVSAGLVILPLDLAGGVDYRLAWKVELTIDQPVGNWVIFVDARTGDLIGRQNNVETAVNGTVKADVQFTGYCDGVSPALPMRDNRVTVVGQGVTYTDSLGRWTLNPPGTGPFTVRDSLKGTYVNVDYYRGNDAAFSGSVMQGAPLNILWNDSNARHDERDVYYNVQVVHKKIKLVDPTFTGMDYSMAARTGRTDNYCPGNAWWDGSAINLCDPGSGYANTGEIGNVVYHEYTHGITRMLYGFDPPSDIHEGNSDVMACYLCDVSIVGIGFYQGNCVGGIRDLHNSLRYPQDLSGEGHHDGQIIGGFHWDARELLKGTVGQPAADSVAYSDWHFGRKLGKATTQPDQVYWTFVADDNDGNLDNGTPHHAEFCQAATNHNFSCPEILTGVQIVHEPLGTTTDPNRVNTVVATITSTEAPINLAACHVTYRVNGGAFSDLPFTYDSGSGTYQSTIPPLPEGSQIEYYIYAQDNLGNFKTDPETAPATLFAFDIAHVFDNLEAESGWTIGLPTDTATTGIWIRCDPVGTAAQPEDDHTPAPGTQCFVTGQGVPGGGVGDNDVDNGHTTLTSPVYDLSGGTNVTVVYYRWYSDDQGNNPSSDPWVVKISNDAGATWAQVESTMVSAASWTRIARPLTDFFPTPGQVQLRFVASDEPPNGSIVEAAVDDFEILANFGSTSVEATGREGGVPQRYALLPASPNPFNPKTVIAYDLPRASSVHLRVFDVQGRTVRTLVSTNQAAGRYGVAWDGKDDRGAAASSGVYFYRLDAGEFTATQKMILTK